MLKKLIPLIFVFLALTLFSVAFIPLSAEDKTSADTAEKAAPAAKIEKKVLTWETEKSKLTFQHEKHANYVKGQCLICHHKMEESGKIQKCETCHPNVKKSPDPKKKTFKRAMHKQCKECHKKEQKGPYKKCGECHIKKEVSE
ncbi:cytochrome c3 family protein [candidate division CSSED10-310 bacterium]|uniref:Cytochrome c3 family protein n=1 Tax=candidate division CSSED10-310 bacterium TaxID=2855610 RepID=A0ABV6Z0Y3_UNCC1